MKGTRATITAGLLAAGLVVGSAGAEDAAPSDGLEGFLESTKPIIDYRLRYESVDQDGLPEDADALTSRLRFGFETAPLLATKLLAEGEWIWAPVGDYNDTIHGKAMYPVVADSEDIELNRLHLTNTGLPDTTLTLGRQRWNQDDQRFVGNVGWRQNEQTLDAVKIENKSIPNTTVTAGYVIQANRVFGDDSPVGNVQGDTVLFNVGYQAPFALISPFAYAIDFEEIDALSSATYGVRLAGKRAFEPVTAHYAASYASQSDAYDNTTDYRANYYLFEGAAEWSGLKAGLGYEVLGSDDGTASFQTPLATGHKFQGWADKFLTTPPNGVADLYASLQYVFGSFGPVANVTGQAIYHDFDADRGSADYGDEIDLQLSAVIKKVAVAVKFADYFAEDFATDTRKIWVQAEFLL